MGRHPMRAAVTLCAAAALAVPLGAASAAPAAQRAVQQVRDPVLVDCSMRGEVRPSAFVLACGDGNSRLTSLHWTRWDAGAAVGRGLNAVNDCVPYCAAGTFRSYPVTVRLDRPEARERDSGQQHFTRMTLTYTDGRPDGFPRVVTYPLWG
ncbi:hypothetical protein [Streptomyces sp. NPDC004783]|uniref:hypothetical protein n=1 Tax=Streptomyces sp. NPDC004783 TaxID=3154459 RepID=UPI0033B58140